jgi:hypothetical protein
MMCASNIYNFNTKLVGLQAHKPTVKIRVDPYGQLTLDLYTI